jgi:hypothetical protein
MALAYLDPAAVPRTTSLNCSEGLPAGPGSSVGRRRQVELLPIAAGFAVSAPAIPELHGLTERTWVLLAVTDLFEAWAIGWPPGGGIELHDHGQSSGAVMVATGTLTETTVRATDSGVAVTESHLVTAGEHRCFGPHYVHDLVNDSDEPAISVHVYGPRLTVMGYYELSAKGRLDQVRTEAVPPVGPFDVTRDHDPS